MAATVVAFTAPEALAQSSGRGDKMDRVLRHRARQLSGRTRVIVQFKGDADVRVFGKRSRTGRRIGRRAQVAELNNFDLVSLAADPRVERVMIDRPTFATLERTGKATGASSARSSYDVTGQGIGVAVIDSGIASTHDDLTRSGWRISRRVVHFKDFTVESGSNLWLSEGEGHDQFGHGTHVAGIIAGTGHDSSGKHIGVAPGANLVGLKVLDDHGAGYISDVIAAIDYAISVRSTYNIRVINLSVAAGVFESYWLDPLTLAARRAVDAGIVVVAAAGNLGVTREGTPQYGAITSPGNAPWVLTVGATSTQGTSRRSDDIVARFSSRGPTWIDFAAKPDIVAPGTGIVSLASPGSELSVTLSNLLVKGSKWLNLSYKPYMSLSGTSMAAPVVSGTVALMLEANPSLTPNAVKAILQYTAQAKTGENTFAQGGGILNTRGAVRMARFFKTPLNGFGNPSDSIDGESVKWARHIFWGNYRITGGVPLPGSNAWSTGVRWGALDTPQGTPVVWGAQVDDNIVWSTAGGDENIVWSTASDDNIVWATVGDDNIVWSTASDDNIVWATARDDDNIVWATVSDDNIVWATMGDDNIVWATAGDDNIVWATSVLNLVWGNDCGGANCAKVVWGTERNGIVLGTSSGDDNIVWATAAADENIVWATAGDNNENIVWATMGDDNIVWATMGDDNIVWATTDDNIVWATSGTVDLVLWAGDDSVDEGDGEAIDPVEGDGEAAGTN
jgi:serine protease AprX